MTSTYDRCLQASREHVDRRTPEQKAWDAKAYKLDMEINALIRMTRVSWKGETETTRLIPERNCINVVADIAASIEAKCRELMVIGDRPGVGPVARIEAPKPITARPVPLSANDRAEEREADELLKARA